MSTTDTGISIGTSSSTDFGIGIGMGIGSGIARITLPEDALDPYVTHGPTRRLLTGQGLPPDDDVFTFTALHQAVRRGGLRTVADSTGDPARLPADLRDQLVIGALRGP